MKLARSVLRCALIILFATAARAGRAADISGLYIGASGGVAQIDTNNDLYESILQQSVAGAGTLDFTSTTLHKRKAAWWVNTGYMAWPYVGFEASYLDFGDLYNQAIGTFTPTGGTAETVGAATRIRSQGPALGMLFRLPLTENFDVNFRAADYYSKTTLLNILNTKTYTTGMSTVSQSSLMAGVGAAYTIAGHWSARIDYLRVQKAGSSTKAVVYNVDMAALGFAYTF
jgi:hypothetical protein